jgi:hypothetical protein
MSKLRFHVIPVIISGSHLVSGGGVFILSVGVNLKLGQSDVTSPANFMCLLHRMCIFQLYLEFVSRNSIFLVKSLLIYDSRSILKCSHGTFVTFIQENGVPRGKLQLLGFFHYNFWHKMSTLNEISSYICTPRGLVLVYVVLRSIICKTISRISDRINRTNFTHN